MRVCVRMADDGVVSQPERRSLISRLLTGTPDPNRPLDHAYVQRRWVRLHRPGPWRVAVSVAAVLAFALLASSALSGTLAVPATWLQRIVVLLVVALLVTGVGILVMRTLAAGVYVTDAAVRLLTVRRTVVLPWHEIRDVRRVPGRVPLLGVPLLPVDGERVQFVLSDGSDLPTPLTNRSADFAGRWEAYDVAALRLERWWLAGRS